MTETIGLDIGSHSIKLAGVRMTPEGPFLTCMGVKEIPPDKREDIEEVSEVLRSLIRETGLRTNKVNLTVSGSGIQIRRLSIPSLPKGEIKEALRWEIKDQLPFPVETAEIYFHILNEYLDATVKKLDLIAVACQKHLVSRTLAIAEKAGLQPVHLDVGPFALWNALLAWKVIGKNETVALIDLGAEKTGIYLFKDDVFQFSREVAAAGNDITRAITEGLSADGEPDLAHDRAEKIKQEIGIPPESYPEGQEARAAAISKISFFVRPMLEKLAAEVGRSLEYYRTLFNEWKIDKVLLTGGGAHLKNIGSYLSGELHLPVEEFNPARQIHVDSETLDDSLLNQKGFLFTAAIGIALPEPARIELLPPKETFLSKIDIEKVFPIAAPAVVLLIFLGILLTQAITKSSLQKELAMKKAKGVNAALQTEQNRLQEQYLQNMNKISQFPPSLRIFVPYEDILKQVSQILPSNVTLISLSVGPKGKLQKLEVPAGDTARELRLSGLTFGSDNSNLTAMALIIERLERNPLFSNVQMVTAAENKLYNAPGADFEIVCDINVDQQKREEKK